MSVIAVGIPAREEVKTKFASDLVLAVCTHVMTHPDDIVIPLFSEGTILASQRTELVKEAIKSGCSHLLFLDSDMRFPGDLISQLMDSMKTSGEFVVAANCARRKIPTGPTAGNVDQNLHKTPVFTTEDSFGLEKVDRVGTAVMLLDMKIFDLLPEPWFATPWVADKSCFMGEDVYLCHMLKRLGVPIVINHDLSKQIKHIGSFEFSYEHVSVQCAMEISKAEDKPLVRLQ